MRISRLALVCIGVAAIALSSPGGQPPEEQPPEHGGGFDPHLQPPAEIGPLCRCQIKSCCVCVQRTRTNALSLTLTGAGGDVVAVTLKPDATGNGPEFKRPGGGRETQADNEGRPLRCTTNGATYRFDIYGGVTGGLFDVEVRIGGGQAVVCGRICVLDPARGQWASLEDTAPPLPPRLARLGRKYRGPLCLPSETLVPLLRQLNAAQQAALPFLVGSAQIAYIGNQPAQHPFGPGVTDARMFKEWKYACSDLQMWCVDGTIKFIWRDRCENGNWILLAKCVFANANNLFRVKLVQCGGATELVETRHFNLKLDAADNETGTFTFWNFDRCSGARRSVRFAGSARRPWEVEESGWGSVEHEINDASPGIDGGVGRNTRPN